jgi:hypothetical protein
VGEQIRDRNEPSRANLAYPDYGAKYYEEHRLILSIAEFLKSFKSLECLYITIEVYHDLRIPNFMETWSLDDACKGQIAVDMYSFVP